MEQNLFIVELTYKKDLSMVDAHLEEHITFLEKYYANGTFIFSGRKNPRNGGVILCHASSLQNVEKLLQDDPFFKNDIADYDITEFMPTKYSEDFRQVLEHL